MPPAVASPVAAALAMSSAVTSPVTVAAFAAMASAIAAVPVAMAPPIAMATVATVMAAMLDHVKGELPALGGRGNGPESLGGSYRRRSNEHRECGNENGTFHRIAPEQVLTQPT